jgi:hypothetical protein
MHDEERGLEPGGVDLIEQARYSPSERSGRALSIQPLSPLSLALAVVRPSSTVRSSTLRITITLSPRDLTLASC